MSASTERNRLPPGLAKTGTTADERGNAEPSAEQPLRIILADDHALFRGGLKLLIRMMNRPVEILEANDFDQAIELLGGDKPIDLLLLDLLMPGMSGIEGIGEICRNWPDVPVVVISVREDSKAIRQALQSGAMGYIPKTSSPEVTTSALQFILSGGIYVPPQVLHLNETRTEVLSTSVNEGEVADSDLTSGTPPYGLTERQIDVLRLMAKGRSNKDIAADLDIAPGTVKMHVSRILRALGVENRTQAASLATQIMATRARSEGES
ncbi:MAG: response regulator transcription factor [Kiloniellales bacterium]